MHSPDEHVTLRGIITREQQDVLIEFALAYPWVPDGHFSPMDWCRYCKVYRIDNLMGREHHKDSCLYKRSRTSLGMNTEVAPPQSGLPPGPLDKLVIMDKEDNTYHCGNGSWDSDNELAEIYNSEDEAKKELDEVDSDEIMRNRLIIEKMQ